MFLSAVIKMHIYDSAHHADVFKHICNNYYLNFNFFYFLVLLYVTVMAFPYSSKLTGGG